MNALKVVFMGTPDFAVPALRAIHEAGHKIVGVYCQPPKPAGRGQKLRKTAVHEVAEEMGLSVFTPKSLRNDEALEQLEDLEPDIIVVAAYGLILPQSVLSVPRLGCLNIHGSLLPRWRGAAPIHRALLAGDDETGITIMQMDAGLDTGDMLIKSSIFITDQSTASSLHDALAEMGAKLIVIALEEASNGSLQPIPQDDAEACYADKLKKEEGLIDWSQRAIDIERQIRALTPWPGCFFKYGDETIKILEATRFLNVTGTPGELMDEEMTIACGTHALRLVTVQRAGKKAMNGEELLRGLRLKKGHIFS